MKIGFIDHYDSFSFNLINWLKSYDSKVEIIYATFDDRKAIENIDRQYLPVVFSPGPNSPEDVRSSLRLLDRIIGSRPVLGVCLGHQIINNYFGGRLVRSDHCFHGTTKKISFRKDSEILSGYDFQKEISVASYNSLVVSKESFPSFLEIEAVCENGEIQALSAKRQCFENPIWGIQFHPESFMSIGCEPLLNSFFQRVEAFYDGISNSSFRA